MKAIYCLFIHFFLFIGVRQKSLHFIFKKSNCVTVSISYSRVGSREPLVIYVSSLFLGFESHTRDKMPQRMINETREKIKLKVETWLLGSFNFNWTLFRISDTKVRTTLHSIINSTTGKYCSVAFI